MVKSIWDSLGVFYSYRSVLEGYGSKCVTDFKETTLEF